MKPFLIKLCISLFAVFAPIRAAVLVAGVLITLDFVLGIAAALKLKEPITSKRMSDTVGKLIAYESTVCIAFLMQHYMMGDLLPVVNVACTYLAIVEGTSVLENLETLTGQPVLSGIIDKLNGMKGGN